MVPWFRGFVVSLFRGSVAPCFRGSVVPVDPWLSGSSGSRGSRGSRGSVDPWIRGFAVSLVHGSVVVVGILGAGCDCILSQNGYGYVEPTWPSTA